MDSSTTIKPKFWTRTKIVIAAVICLLLAFGAFLFSQKVNPSAFHNRPNAENLNKLSEEELAEAQEEIESAFLLVPESAVVVSHVNLNALKPEAQQQWWDEWFFKMLPPEMTKLQSLEGLEGLNSITIASYRPVQEFNPDDVSAWIDVPLLYTVIFNVDSEFANQSRELIAERNDNPTETLITLPASMGGFLDENGVSLDHNQRTQSIAVTQILGVDYIQALNNGEGESLEPNLDWFGVDAEPILYLNVSQYLDSFSFTTDEVLGNSNNDIRKAMLGIESSKDFIWIGESLDFGTTWEKKANVEENKTNSNNPSLINIEAFSKAVSETTTPGLVDVNGELFVPPGANDPNQDILVEAGIADMGLTGIFEAVSIKIPGQGVFGAARDPYSLKPGIEADPVVVKENTGTTKPPTEEDIIVVISPINLLNAYKGSIAPSWVRTMTFTFSPNDSSTLIFDFKTQAEIEQDAKEIEEESITVDENEGPLAPPDENTEEIIVEDESGAALLPAPPVSDDPSPSSSD